MMHRVSRPLWISLALVAAAVLAACAPAPAAPWQCAGEGTTCRTGEGAFGTVLAARFSELKVPGVGFAVVERGRLIEAGGFGVRSIRTGEPVTEATPFRVASLTKPISAGLLLTAVEAGRVDLDTPLIEASRGFRERCPELKIAFEKRDIGLLRGIACDDPRVTLRAAATHTSRSPVGSRYRYNGYLFNQLTEAITGPDRNMVQVFRASVIQPLGLQNSAAGIRDGFARDVIEALAPPHRRGSGGAWQTRPRLKGPLGASAGLIASARDMARIDTALVPGGLVSPGVWRRMTTNTVLTDGRRSPYGIGWFRQRIDGRDILWHYGLQNRAYSALWIRDLAHRRSLILLANAEGLTGGYRLGAGDLTRAPAARWFLAWSAQRGG